MILLSAFLFGLMLFGEVKSMPSSKNDCDIKRIDRCAQRLYIYGDPDFKVATTVEEAKQFCKSTKEAEQCIRNFNTNCAKPFARQYINLIVSGPSQQLKKRCSLSGIRKFLEHRDCVNSTKNGIDKCNDAAIKDTMRIIKAKKEDWIPLSCCVLSKSTQCSLKVVDHEQACVGKSTEYMKDAIRGFAGEMFDLFCGAELQWGSPACTKVTSTLAPLGKVKRPLSIFPVVLEMMEKF